MTWRLALAPVVLCASGAVLGGCAAAPGGAGECVATPYIAPASVTLDHTAPPPGNSVQFTTGVNYVGAECVQSAVRVNYSWAVSDTTAASITSPGGLATCVAASSSPVVVSSYLAGVNSSGAMVLTPSGLPSASLVCK